MKYPPASKTQATTRVRETATPPPATHLPRKPEFDEIREIRKGLPVSRFFALQDQLGVSTAQLAEVAGIPLRTLQRRKDEGRLSKEESDRLDRISQLTARAADVFESPEAAREWLTHPQIGLAGFSPLEIADTGAGVREAENLLGRIDYGVYA